MVVDDIWKTVAPFCKEPGPKPECTDRELIAMSLIGECRGWHMETELLSCWKNYQHLFSHLPSQSRFNRRRRNLMQATNLIRLVILRSLDLSRDSQCLIDSLLFRWFNFTWFPVLQATEKFIKPLLARRLPKNKPPLAIGCIC